MVFIPKVTISSRNTQAANWEKATAICQAEG